MEGKEKPQVIYGRGKFFRSSSHPRAISDFFFFLRAKKVCKLTLLPLDSSRRRRRRRRRRQQQQQQRQQRRRRRRPAHLLIACGCVTIFFFGGWGWTPLTYSHKQTLYGGTQSTHTQDSPPPPSLPSSFGFFSFLPASANHRGKQNNFLSLFMLCLLSPDFCASCCGGECVSKKAGS